MKHEARDRASQLARAMEDAISTFELASESVTNADYTTFIRKCRAVVEMWDTVQATTPTQQEAVAVVRLENAISLAESFIGPDETRPVYASDDPTLYEQYVAAAAACEAALLAAQKALED